MSDLKVATAVVFAGGVGTRMRSKDLPKQFLMIHGKPIIVRTAETFQQCKEIDNIIVVCVSNWVDHCRQMMDSFGIAKVKAVIPGGNTGQESIANGLRVAADLSNPSETIVLIHDGVRPLIDVQTILNNIESVKQYGSAITCAKAKETIMLAPDYKLQQIIPREQALLARAPQSFILEDLLAAHAWAKDNSRNDYIDSACLMTDFGKDIHLVDGPDENIKITTQRDYYSMRAILDSIENDQLYSINGEETTVE